MKYVSRNLKSEEPIEQTSEKTKNSPKQHLLSGLGIDLSLGWNRGRLVIALTAALRDRIQVLFLLLRR
ncbi:hypothetical protein LEP1GSC047_0598 [Leptospira inadai serovar Lyme str. 10]|uniref:Uncharacterized protein n=1 Tax=Leptospira inadai serovar Lyme str. 10 TaxID=1049790 RepID=V6H9I7_9LEPT|nr:hypothetical protein [Leptospira inadai]EQA35826.1 hypothetical protein LEP1GSC047_0598 [Leptospira inadai serovar Lyme str. 10]